MIKIVEIAVIAIIMATIIGEMEFGQEMKERLKIPIITKVHQILVQVLIKGPQVDHQITMEMLLYLLEKCENRSFDPNDKVAAKILCLAMKRFMLYYMFECLYFP